MKGNQGGMYNVLKIKRKFTGVPFTPTPKCAACEQFEQCRNRDNILTSRQMVVVCEGFYYLFKRLEKFDKLPTIDESIEKTGAH